MGNEAFQVRWTRALRVAFRDRGTVSDQPTDSITFDELYRVLAYTGAPRSDGTAPILCRSCGAGGLGVRRVVFADGRTVGCSKCRRPLVPRFVPPKYGGLIGPGGTAALHIAHGTRPVRWESEDESPLQVRQDSVGAPVIESASSWLALRRELSASAATVLRVAVLALLLLGSVHAAFNGDSGKAFVLAVWSGGYCVLVGVLRASEDRFARVVVMTASMVVGVAAWADPPRAGRSPHLLRRSALTAHVSEQRLDALYQRYLQRQLACD